MTDHQPNLQYPFSPDPSELVVCRNENQIRQVQAAFHYDARYVSWFSALCGARYDKVIVFKPSHFESQIMKEAFERQLYENYPTWIKPKGSIIIIDC